MSIELIIGPMFSSKTTTMFNRIRRAQHAGQRTTIFKYDKDLRYDDDITLACSHDGIKMEAIPIHSLEGIGLPDSDVIGFDEGQFLIGLPEWAHAAANAGKRVVIAALDSMFNMNPWPVTNALIPISEQITKLSAICYRCKQDAAFTKRIDNTNTAAEDIGGADKYVASCRKCFV
jgi:thymidine kinase